MQAELARGSGKGTVSAHPFANRTKCADCGLFLSCLKQGGTKPRTLLAHGELNRLQSSHDQLDDDGTELSFALCNALFFRVGGTTSGTPPVTGSTAFLVNDFAVHDFGSTIHTFYHVDNR